MLKHITLLINAELMGKALCPLLCCNIKIKTKTEKMYYRLCEKGREVLLRLIKRLF